MDIQSFLQPAGFQQLVAQLLSQDVVGDQRKQAEAIFDQVKQHPDACAGNLLAIMRSSPQVEHRSFAAIMLRKVRDRRAILGRHIPVVGNCRCAPPSLAALICAGPHQG